MKRNYVKPTCSVIEINHSQILCASGYSNSGYRIEDTFLKKNRQSYMIECGANITKYPMNPKDVFVYERKRINDRIVKKTPNPPKIGSVVQLDYNPKVLIYKHLHDGGYDYWYCKYMSNNGRDAKATY